MPSKSKKQHNFMEMVAHNPKMAKKVGVPQSVGKDFVAADKRKKFSTGERPDLQKANIKKTDHGQSTLFKEGGIMKHDDMKQDMPMMAKVASKAVKGHEKKMHGMAKGGKAKCMAKGGGCEVKGKTKGRMV